MSSHRPTHLGAMGIALFVTFLWSSSWVLIRWGLDEEALEPLTFASLRYGLAAAILVGWVLARPHLRRNLHQMKRPAIGRIAILGLVFYALTQGAQFVAIDNQPAATTSLVLSWTPLLVAVLAGRSLAEVPSSRQTVGTLLVALGAWLYFAGDLGATTAGMIAAVIGLAANVASALLGRHINREGDVEPVVVTALSMVVGAVLLVFAGLATEGVPAVSLRAWVIVVVLAVVNTALAFTLWNLSLRRLSALESAAVNNTMLIQIALLAWIFLDEALGYSELTGIALVSAGILLTQTAIVVRKRTRSH